MENGILGQDKEGDYFYNQDEGKLIHRATPVLSPIEQQKLRYTGWSPEDGWGDLPANRIFPEKEVRRGIPSEIGMRSPHTGERE